MIILQLVLLEIVNNQITEGIHLRMKDLITFIAIPTLELVPPSSIISTHIEKFRLFFTEHNPKAIAIKLLQTKTRTQLYKTIGKHNVFLSNIF